jgi:hypothetical protein
VIYLIQSYAPCIPNGCIKPSTALYQIFENEFRDNTQLLNNDFQRVTCGGCNVQTITCLMQFGLILIFSAHQVAIIKNFKTCV